MTLHQLGQTIGEAASPLVDRWGWHAADIGLAAVVGLVANYSRAALDDDLHTFALAGAALIVILKVYQIVRQIMRPGPPAPPHG